MKGSVEVGRAGMVATQHDLAVEAALEVLDAGGTAADGAVAAAAVLCVVDPRSTGLGGDVFALYWEQGSSLPVALSSAGVAPRTLTVDALRAAGHATMPTDGPWSITVPGAPAGWEALLGRFGRLDRERLLAPAIRHARDGHAVRPAVAAEWTTAVAKLERNAAASTTFLVDGRPPKDGEWFAVPDLAATLERFVADGAEPFYRGDLAERIGATVAGLGGPLRADDLAAWRGPEWVDPITAPYRGIDVYEMPPPVQGLVALEALRIYERIETSNAEDEDHAAIEAIKLAYEDANDYIADPEFTDVPVELLLSNGHIEAQRRRITADGVLSGAVGRPSDTVYAAVVDGDGNACSFIQSVYDGFGSGVVVPGTGMALQNRGSGFRLHDTHPNRPEPGKRPLHTILPAMLGADAGFGGCLAVVGGYMQPQGQLQVLRNILDRGMTPQQAVDAPRFRVYRGREVALEEGYDAAVAEGLRRRGHEVTRLDPFERGGGQVILRDGDQYRGGSDRRKDGYAAGR
jgi:gamma-glutamyltranspeptidase/glutathione hydrolase